MLNEIIFIERTNYYASISEKTTAIFYQINFDGFKVSRGD